MIKVIKDQWEAALRLRYYQKCHNVLHVGSRFNAFGVLCDLFLRAMDQSWGSTNQRGAIACLGCITGLPLNVARWADGKPILIEDNTIVEGPINDSIYWKAERDLIKEYELQLSFSSIADKISKWEVNDA